MVLERGRVYQSEQLNGVPFMSFYVMRYLHRSPIDVGFIVTLFGLGYIIGAIAGGRFTDIFRFRAVQIFGTLA